MTLQSYKLVDFELINISESILGCLRLTGLTNGFVIPQNLLMIQNTSTLVEKLQAHN